eukprot:gene5014-22054_t
MAPTPVLRPGQGRLLNTLLAALDWDDDGIVSFDDFDNALTIPGMQQVLLNM